MPDQIWIDVTQPPERANFVNPQGAGESLEILTEVQRNLESKRDATQSPQERAIWNAAIKRLKTFRNWIEKSANKNVRNFLLSLARLSGRLPDTSPKPINVFLDTLKEVVKQQCNPATNNVGIPQRANFVDPQGNEAAVQILNAVLANFETKKNDAQSPRELYGGYVNRNQVVFIRHFK